MSDLDGLPDMSPIDEPELPWMPDRLPRSPRMTIAMMMILAGIVLTLLCGFLLFVVFGLASMVPEDDPGYWSVVLDRMFGAEYGGWVAIPASMGFLLGVILVVLGGFKVGKHR
jgi:hypothetical protein